MTRNLLRDPFYVPIIASIEMVIVKVDEQAAEDGLTFTDSQVNAVLHRAIRHMQGKPPKAKAPTSEKERRQEQMLQDLLDLRPTIHTRHRETGERKVLAQGQFGAALRAVQDLLKNRKAPEGGGRDYLDAAGKQVAKMRAQEAAQAAENEENDSSSG